MEGAVDIIYRTLASTGLIHDEGPDKDGGVGPYVQSERQAQGIYLEYAKKLIDKGRKMTVVLGFNTASEVFYEEEFRALGAEVFVTTADGTHGIKGFVTTAIAEKKPDFDYFYACGPLPMLRALSDATGDIPGELSFEERMGCGFGGCMGCSCQTKNGAKRICKEGPVLKKEEIIW